MPTQDKNMVVLVEFAPRAGLRPVSLGTVSTEELVKKSTMALDSAMDTVQSMAQRVNKMVRLIPEQPDDIEVTFGITMDAEAGALIARAGVEAAISVSLTWKKKEIK